MSDIYYVVELNEDGSNSFYALGENGSPALFTNNSKALSFRKELHDAGCSWGKIKKVRVEITEIEGDGDAPAA